MIASIKKALDVLDILIFEDAQGRGLRLSELSERLDIKPNTLHGILQTIVACGYAEQDSETRYHIGKRCRQIGVINRFRITPGMAEKLNGALGRLCDETGESVSFYVLDDGDRIIYANFSSKDIIKVDYTMLEEDSMYAYPSGRVLLAHAEGEALEAIIQKHGMPPGVESKWQLSEVCSELRERWMLTKNKNGVASFSIPVYYEEQLLGAVGVYMPSYRCTEEKENRIKERLRAFAEEVWV